MRLLGKVISSPFLNNTGKIGKLSIGNYSLWMYIARSFFNTDSQVLLRRLIIA